jgi:hypothetical protein
MAEFSTDKLMMTEIPVGNISHSGKKKHDL